MAHAQVFADLAGNEISEAERGSSGPFARELERRAQPGAPPPRCKDQVSLLLAESLRGHAVTPTPETHGIWTGWREGDLI